MNSLKIFLNVEYLTTSENQRIMFPIFVDVLLHHKANQKRNSENNYYIVSTKQGRLRWGGRRGNCPLCLRSWGQEEQELPFILNSFHLSYLQKRHFSSIVDSLIQETFSVGKPPDPYIIVVFPGDRCITHCSSGREFNDQNLALWRNIYMHRFALIGSIAPPAQVVPGTKASLKAVPHSKY